MITKIIVAVSLGFLTLGYSIYAKDIDNAASTEIDLKRFASEAVALSKSPHAADRINSANRIASFPAFISRETEETILRRLCVDPVPSVREAALGAIESLADIALIEPFLPLVRKMRGDAERRVSAKATTLYEKLSSLNVMFKKQRITEDKARAKFFSGGLVPVLY